MEIESARLLIEIAHRASFAEVARDRGIDPSRISRMIGAIEAELGFRLFQRTTRRVAPTEAGDIYLRRMAAVVEQADQARDEALSVSEGPSGMLRFTTSVAFGQQIIVPLVPKFHELFPKIDLELILSDSNLDLVAERIDLAVRLGPGVSGDVTVRKLAETSYRVCASPDYLSRHGRPATPADLAAHDCLLLALSGYRTRWLFRTREASEVIPVGVKGAIVVSGALALRQLALAGMGPALMADWLIDGDIARGALADLFPNFRVTATAFDTAVWLVYPSRTFLPRKVRSMIDFLTADESSRVLRRAPGLGQAAMARPDC